MLVDGLVRDALALLEVVSGWELDGPAAGAVALLALVAGQDVEPAAGSDGTDGRWQVARKVVPDRVLSVVDPDARHAHKTVSRRQDGFKAHLAVEPDTGLVTGCELSRAAGPHTADGTSGPPCWHTTTASPARWRCWATAPTAPATLDRIERAGHRALVKPWPTRPAVPSGFDLDDFTVNEQAQTVTCPAGVTRPPAGSAAPAP